MLLYRERTRVVAPQTAGFPSMDNFYNYGFGVHRSLLLFRMCRYRGPAGTTQASSTTCASSDLARSIISKPIVRLPPGAIPSLRETYRDIYGAKANHAQHACIDSGIANSVIPHVRNWNKDNENNQWHFKARAQQFRLWHRLVTKTPRAKQIASCGHSKKEDCCKYQSFGELRNCGPHQ